MAPAPPAHSQDIRRAVLFVAVPAEMSVLNQHLPTDRVREVEGTHFRLAWWEARGVEWEIILVRTGMGNRTPAALLERARAEFRPQAAFFAGIAAALKDVAPGDVVIGSSSKGYAIGKEDKRGFLTRVMSYHSAYLLDEIASELLEDTSWYARRHRAGGRDAHVARGVIASGDVVLADDLGDILKQVRLICSDALCVEMEGLGFLEALHMMQSVDGLIVRGISDSVGNKSSLDAGGFQAIAADAAIAFTLEVIARYGRSKGARRKPAYGRILFDGRRDLRSAHLRHNGQATRWKDGKADGPIGAGEFIIVDSSTAIIRKKSCEGRYELHFSFRRADGVWQNELPPTGDQRVMRRIRISLAATASECEHTIRIVLADKSWGALDERIVKVPAGQTEEIDIILSARRDQAWYLRLEDREVRIQPADLRLSDMVVIEENH
jgi:nucleoside phosphorylase